MQPDSSFFVTPYLYKYIAKYQFFVSVLYVTSVLIGSDVSCDTDHE
jgi:hypothetical protein